MADQPTAEERQRIYASGDIDDDMKFGGELDLIEDCIGYVFTSGFKLALRGFVRLTIGFYRYLDERRIMNRESRRIRRFERFALA